ncbi:NAD(P)H-dependent flavin oxidoreductase [Brachymonas denitrificans]|jgi:nitronate monooxygenase|uniref:Nitronate monooxygenase n=1 Tax=Brachymonas denitrificans DSM 15123 TaxID=1121117 RepID=A0A1H8J7K1_9BURK|nr:nitronate monooxygenase family protein [Brachymonas denitrificans]SEN76068.1 nitronate monooxygenase [Brachymonas denitrificans DSM 15123]
MSPTAVPLPTFPSLAEASALVEQLREKATASGLKLWSLAGKTLIPVVQGGMGVGISAGGLAGTVARMGAVGTISSVDLRRLHPDLMEKTRPLEKSRDVAHAKGVIDAANNEALRREIARAREISQGLGLIAVNVMKAISAYAQNVRTALEAGIDAVVVGAGLPLDLPELAKDHPKAALIPILSDARGVQLIVKKWEKKGRLPDAIVIEHPRLAGGHLGAAKIMDLNDPRFDFENVLPAVREFLRSAGYERHIPLIAAGGVSSHEDIQRLQELGADAVQMGTAFAVTQESDAAPEFKQVLANARPEDVVEFISVAGLPARGVRTPWLDKYLRIEPKLQAVAHEKRCNMAFDCLQHCGLRDGKSDIGQFCIDKHLGHAQEGDTQKGLFFRGAGKLPFGSEIRPVQDLLQRLLGGRAAVANP